MKKNIVTIGGGTGQFMLLSGLKKYPVSLSAIVSMADDGGSTGILRDELGVLPPGDIRQCLVALSNSSDTLRKLFTYRFERGGLAGHNFGNLFLSALEKLNGNFEKAVEEAMSILNVSGTVLPITTRNARLLMTLNDGTLLKGENAICSSSLIHSIGIRSFRYRPSVQANPRALAAIQRADIIVIGPGNHYGSVIPNLLVSGICPALRKTKALIVYISNVTNKRGQTDGYTARDYYDDIAQHIGSDRIKCLVVNTAKPKSRLMKKYERSEGKGFLTLPGNLSPAFGPRVITGDYVSKKDYRTRAIYAKSDAIAQRRSFIRHDGDKLARTIMALLAKR